LLKGFELEMNLKKTKLLPASALLKTGDVDHAIWNYRPVLGLIQRLRFRLIRSLLGKQRYPRLLEIGYGSGVFMPELALHCNELYGIDPHHQEEAVTEVLAKHGVTAKLASGSAESMPYEDSFFDAVVVVSALEFIPDLEKACHEIRRVLAPNGIVAIVTPGHSPMVDFGLRVLTGKSPAKDFEDRRQAILPCLGRSFHVQKRIQYPPLLHHVVRLYTALRMDTL
jgi:ubiquinone/menaquinone biosynthesis C-methylase UbiE